MGFGNCLRGASWTKNPLSPEHLRDLACVHFWVQVCAEFSQMYSDDFVPFCIVLWWVNIVDVRLEPIPGRLVDQLFFVRGRDDNHPVLGPQLAQLRFYLGEDLVARGISSPEDRVRLIQ